MKNLLICCSLLLAMSACKKESSSDSGSKKQLLTSGKWKITSSSGTTDFGAGPIPFDLYALMQPCDQDNLYIFNGDQTATMDEGATKCDPADPQQVSAGTWQLLNNDTQMQFSDLTSPVGSGLVADILQLDNSVMTVKYTTVVNGFTSVTTTSYTHLP